MKKVKVKRANSNNSTYFCGDDKWSLIYGDDKENEQKSEYYGYKKLKEGDR